MNLIKVIKDAYSPPTTVKSDGIVRPSTFDGFNLLSRIHAGVKVTPETALAHDTVFACVRDKAETIGQLPVKLTRTRSDGSKEKVTSGREFKKFTQRPNDFQTMQEFIEMGVATMELKGAFYAYILRNKHDNITEILPFRYQTGVNPAYDTYGNVYYTYTTNDGKPQMVFANRDIFVIRNFTLDGITPCSSIYYGARSIGLAISQEEYLAALMENGAMPLGILHTDNIFKDDNAIERLKGEWSNYSGKKNAGKTPVLENGLKYQAMSISPADTQLVLQRNLSREQICAMLRVPQRRVGVPITGTQRDVGEDNKDYMQNSLIPIITKIENAFNYALPDTLNMKLDETGFLRGDLKSTAEAAHEVVKSGLGSINEGREILGWEPKEGGDVHAIDTNNLTFGELTDIQRIQRERQRLLERSQPQQEVNDDET